MNNSNESIFIIASKLAASHVADPLVGQSVAASDADEFDFRVLSSALAEAGLPSDEDEAEALREALRSALARY